MISDAGIDRLNQLAVTYVERQVGEGIHHAFTLMTGSTDEKLAEHAHELVMGRVDLDLVEPIELDTDTRELFRRIYLHGSGIAESDGDSLKKWIETGKVN